jgi:uncharacterized protein
MKAFEMPIEAIGKFCQRWKIREFSVFGSVLRDDFTPDSDVDVLVSFYPGTFWGFESVDMKDELEAMFGRRVDLLTKEGLQNPSRREQILSTRRVLYAA